MLESGAHVYGQGQGQGQGQGHGQGHASQGHASHSQSTSPSRAYATMHIGAEGDDELMSELRDSDGSHRVGMFTLVRRWSAETKAHSIMHDMAWTHYRNWNMATMVPAMLLSSVSGISTVGIGQSSGECGSGNISLTVLGVCGIVGATLMAINRYMMFSELQQLHDVYSDNYEILHRDIKFNLSVCRTPHSVFANDVEFIKNCKAHLDLLIDKAPAIPYVVRRRIERLRLRAESEAAAGGGRPHSVVVGGGGGGGGVGSGGSGGGFGGFVVGGFRGMVEGFGDIGGPSVSSANGPIVNLVTRRGADVKVQLAPPPALPAGATHAYAHDDYDDHDHDHDAQTAPPRASLDWAGRRSQRTSVDRATPDKQQLKQQLKELQEHLQHQRREPPLPLPLPPPPPPPPPPPAAAVRSPLWRSTTLTPTHARPTPPPPPPAAALSIEVRDPHPPQNVPEVIPRWGGAKAGAGAKAAASASASASAAAAFRLV
jgi:hypothetical protein